MDFRQYIQAIPNFPKPGIIFWDFSPLLAVPEAFSKAIQEIMFYYRDKQITKIAAIEAKGFTIGAALAYNMQLPLSLIRKPGLIPGQISHMKFIKEYGEGEYQIKTNSFNSDDRVLIVYDIMAGAGASKAAVELIEYQGASVVGCSYIIELEYLSGRELLKHYDLFSLVKIRENPNQQTTDEIS